jgi:hypothetical protein
MVRSLRAKPYQRSVWAALIVAGSLGLRPIPFPVKVQNMNFPPSLGYILSASVALSFTTGCAGNLGGATPASSALQQASGHVSPDGIVSQTCSGSITSKRLQPVKLRSASTFAVLGGSTVTSSGPTVLNGDLGVFPGTSITGFGPGIVNGTIHAGDPVAGQAQADLLTAYNDAASRKHPGGLPSDIGGMTMTPGVWNVVSSLGISGTVTFDGQNDPDSVYIIQIPSTLTSGVNSNVVLINKANACNIFWQVGSSATLQTASTFSGTIMAAASVSLGTGTIVNGRVLAEVGAVTLLSNTVTVPQ